MAPPNPVRVLVLDADMVPALTIVRSLLRRKCHVEIASHAAHPLARYSRGVRASYRYPDPLANAQSFLDWLVEHALANHYDLVIPVTERSLSPLSAYREQLAGVKVAMPSARSLELVLDKSQTLSLAASLGVPVPGGITVNSQEEVFEHRDTLRYPVVLKPARSIGTREGGGASHLQVSYAYDRVGLVAGCNHALRFGPVLLQEYFRGDGVGVELIAKAGEIVYAFQHRRLHEVPLTGGGSSLRISEPVNPQLLEASRLLISALQWNGVAMVEFKLDRDSGEFCLMEINGRFWGSLPLAAAAGADFPAMLLDLELEGSVTESQPYRSGVYCRLLSRDLMWYESVLRGATDDRIVQLPSRWEVFKGLSLLLHPAHRFDVQSLTDPRPGLVDLGRICDRYYQRLRGLLRDKWFLRGQKSAWRRGVVHAAIAEANSMLFLCYGNINRSALADALLSGYAADVGVTVRSAGFHPQEGREADPVMIRIAAEAGVDMRELRSSVVSAELLQSSDIIFVMEKQHYDRLVHQSPGVAGRVFLLGAHQGSREQSAEIDDPFGLAPDDYHACYVRIAEAIDHIKAIVAVRSAE
ncbi:MAG: ATP-grasp domain-containing protein [Halioglobus sp.]|nr:ATP-grasp domain-containing protein [Halioglobus sp.]